MPSHPPAVTDTAAARLRDDIVEGVLRPGQQLVEADLVERLGVSRNSLREAFRQLCREGLAEHHRHRGVTVRRVTVGDLREIFVVRRLLELPAITNGPTPLTADSLAGMRACVEAAEAAAARKDWRAVGTHSLRFHGAIVGLAGSALLDGFFTTILAQLRLTFAVGSDEGAFQTPWIARDRMILDRLSEDDRAGAEAALRRYLDESEAGLLARFS